MDIKIEAPNHGRQEMTHDFYNKKLNQKYGKYAFIKSIDVKIKSDDNLKEVSLLIKPEKGTSFFTSGQDKSENVALRHAIKRMNSQIEKYKEIHYQNAHLVNKNARIELEDNNFIE